MNRRKPSPIIARMEQPLFLHDNVMEKGGFFLSGILLLVQLCVTVIMGVYFFSQVKAQRQSQPAVKREDSREMENLRKMRQIALSAPLAEHVRPKKMNEIIGQEDGIRSLKAILCGANPQHVIIYGPPGIGKTCAARIVLEYAKKSPGTPFLKNAPFIEMDATCVRFDERAIADPLIGSVHDPIYQGAGKLGMQGIPQPMPGAVSRAHGGVLFLDEIGELHPIQMNKLLKVLEDRLVRFESAYYKPEDPAIPRYIHEIFRNGLPADFRLVGATTKSPEEMPPALRSRCMEIYFRPLDIAEVSKIAFQAAERTQYMLSQSLAELIGRFAACGREAVNMVQMASGVAQLDDRREITRSDIEWVVQSGHYQERPRLLARLDNRVGAIHALAVAGANQGAVMEIEAVARRGDGRVRVTGIVEEEQMGGASHVVKRKSSAHASAENVLTLLFSLGYADQATDLHINFPGGVPVDGPSAGAAMAVVAVSALTGREIAGDTAITGEIGVHGEVRPVGGVPEKIEAAIKAGLRRVLIPKENARASFDDLPIEVVRITALHEAMALMLPSEGNCLQEAADSRLLPASALIAAGK